MSWADFLGIGDAKSTRWDSRPVGLPLHGADGGDKEGGDKELDDHHALQKVHHMGVSIVMGVQPKGRVYEGTSPTKIR